MRTELLDGWSGLDAVRAEWGELHRGGAGRNPFASPDWILPWARHFVAERDLAVLTVRRCGQLIGVAPCYRRRFAGLARGVQLMGSARHDSLTELRQVLAAPGEHRSVLRAVVAYWAHRIREWDWLDLPMLADQGWFEPDWLTGPATGAIIQHRITRPAVVLPLPATRAELTGAFKRNLLESAHRGRNRLDRTAGDWRITTHGGEHEIGRALQVLAGLHARRSVIAGRRHHPDELSDPVRMAFLGEALPAMARRGEAEILTLDVDGRAVAAQLVLIAPQASYLGPSGVDPDWWNVGPVTLLQVHAAETAVDQGRAEFNLSVGPSVAKLRWSECVQQHPEFVVCGRRRRSAAVFTALRIGSVIASIHREARRHRTVPPAGPARPTPTIRGGLQRVDPARPGS